MSKSQKVACIVLGVLVLTAGVVVLLVSRVDIQSRFEAVASEATGLEVSVRGGASVGLFPTLHIALQDVTLKNHEAQIATIGEADIGVAFWPLLRQQVSIDRLVVKNASIEIERDRNGQLKLSESAHTPSQGDPSAPAIRLGRLSLAKVTFSYKNRQLDKELKATDCRFDSSDVQLIEGAFKDIMKHLSLSARVACAEMRNDLFIGTDVQFSVAGEDGVFKVTPLTMQMLDGKGSGSVDANFTGAAPTYRVRYAVKQLHVNSLFKSLAPGKVGDGFLDFATDLSMHGFNAEEMTRTADGEASLQGKDLEIAIGDLDQKLSRYESSQNFNLVDVGAFFIAGPFGTAITKGYDFASIFRGTGGNTHINTLVSQWHVENGVAQARDVAMATKENRLAMKGALDFVHKTFDEVTVAKLDDRGCARVEQKIRGPFSKPEITKPNVLVSLTGPIGSVIDKAKKLVGVKCDVFYAGTIPP